MRQAPAVVAVVPAAPVGAVVEAVMEKIFLMTLSLLVARQVHTETTALSGLEVTLVLLARPAREAPLVALE